MEFNNILRELNYYLGRIFLTDVGYKKTIRIVEGAGLKPEFISSFQGRSVDVWYEILKHALSRTPERVTEILISILKEPDLSDDEYIKGAMQNLNEQKDITVGPVVRPAEGKKPQTIEMAKEKIIGKKSTILPIGFLKKGTTCARSVVRIVIGRKLGTGFIVKNNWLITNNHVIASIEEASNAMIQFNYEFPEDMLANAVADVKPERSEKLNPEKTEGDGLFYTDPKQDWTIVKINGDISQYGSLNFSAKEVAEEDFVNIIQHPSGGPKQLAIYNNLVMYVDDANDGFIVQYLTDTLPGSSGAPVLNSNWEVVALHHSGGWVQDPSLSAPVYRNQGTNIKRIETFMKSKGLLN